MEENKVETKERKLTREEILAMKPGRELDALYHKNIKGYDHDFENCHWCQKDFAGNSYVRGNPHFEHYSTDKSLLTDMLHEEGKPGNYFGTGLFIAPLNNGQWVCGRAVKIYNIKITDEHYQDKELVICDTPMEAACKMRLILALCPEEARSTNE